MLMVALSSYQQLADDLALIGKLVDQPGLSAALDQTLNQLTQGQGLPGLDKSKPWGLTVSSDGQQFHVLAFLPIADTGKFIDALGPVLGKVTKEEEDVWTVELDFQNPLALFIQELYFTNKNGWTFLCTQHEMLDNLPDDPVELLDGLEKEYHLAARVEFQNIPDVLRQLGLGMMKNAAEQGIQAQGDEGAVPTDVVQQMVAEGLDSVATMLNELDQITIGFKLDHEKNKALLDVVITAVDNTDAAKEMARYTEAKTRFSGFLLADAAVSGHVSIGTGEDDLGNTESAVKMLRSLFAEAGEDEDEDEEGQEDFALDLVFDMMSSVMEQMIESGRLDAAISVTDDEQLTVIAGLRVKDGDALSKEIEKRIETIENDLGFFGIEKETIEDDQIKLYYNSEAIPGEEGQALAKLFGEKFQIVVGTAKDAFYLAIGQDAVEPLKEAIAKSKAAGEKSVPPMQFQGRLTTLMKFLTPLAGVFGESIEGNPQFQDLAESLGGEKDRIDVVLKPIDRGMHIRVEAEEGILKAMGTLITSMGIPGLPQFAP